MSRTYRNSFVKRVPELDKGTDHIQGIDRTTVSGNRPPPSPMKWLAM
jgi:hypothetical protein